MHERAGTHDVIRFHGSIWELRCWNECDAAANGWWDETAPLPTLPPRCPHCHGLARPGVVWFGEAIDPAVVERSVAATACDLFLTIGTSAVVYPAAALVHEAQQRGAYTVEINLESTPASSVVDLAVEGPAEHVLDQLDAAIRSSSSESAR